MIVAHAGNAHLTSTDLGCRVMTASQEVSMTGCAMSLLHPLDPEVPGGSSEAKKDSGIMQV